ncbi:hypothetical protein LPJ70_004905, partial [Coemansia sp. RSA 2708]
MASRFINVPVHAAGMRLDRFIANETNISTSLLFKLLRKRAVAQIDDSGRRKRLHPNDRVSIGMCISLPCLVTPKLKAATVKDAGKAQELIQRHLPIIRETAAVAVFQKPAGLACQGGSGITYSIDALLQTTGVAYRLVHRLDRNTTGALAVAKTRAAAAALTHAFRQRLVSKNYVAVLDGHPRERQGTIDNALLNTGTSCLAITPISTEQQIQAAKHAVTNYKVIKRGVFNGQPVSIVALDIPTGRKHQIRVHCAQILNCPVLGDTRYGDTVKAANHMYLHLVQMTIPDVQPNGEPASAAAKITVKSPFPLFWQPVFDALEPSANVRRMQALATAALAVAVVRRRRAPWGLGWLERQGGRLAAWKAAVLWWTVLYLARHMDDVLGLHAPEPLRAYYSRSFYRATWVFTALDAGFWTAMTVRPKWLRDVLSLVFSAYYLVCTDRAVEKVRTSWNKGVDNPVLRFVRSLHEPRLGVRRV